MNVVAKREVRRRDDEDHEEDLREVVAGLER
jgi:hypothetical protein